MTVHVEGKDVQEVLSKVYSQRDRNSWISINPSHTDCGRYPVLGFAISWRGGEENFTRKVDSVTELLKVLRPILLVHEGRIRTQIQKAEHDRVKEIKAALKKAKAEVKKIEAQQ